MEYNSDSYESSEWEDDDIPSLWIWRKADVDKRIGGEGADTSHLALCQRRENGRIHPKLYIRKLLSKKPGHGTKYMKRELNMLRQCEHLYILRYEDFEYKPSSFNNPSAKLYTEFCEQGDLGQFTASAKGPNWRLSIAQFIQVFSQITQALLYIHHGISLTRSGLPEMAKIHTAQSSRASVSKGDWKTILHRGIKPSNIFVAQLSRQSIHVKLGDFEFARLDTDKSQSYVGTRGWLAPEQRHSNNNRPDGERRTTLKSDILSFGLTMRAVKPQPVPEQDPPTHAFLGIGTLIRRCLHQTDTQRPTSAMIIDELKRYNVIQRAVSMIQDIASQHLFSPVAEVRELFWRHETDCQLCRRLLKAGGVGYVYEFDNTRETRFRRPWPNESMPLMPPSMDMSRLSNDQIQLVQFLRAHGMRRNMAIVCVRAKSVLKGTVADGEEVALLVNKGWTFKQAIALFHQEKREEAQQDSEDEDSD